MSSYGGCSGLSYSSVRQSGQRSSDLAGVETSEPCRNIHVDLLHAAVYCDSTLCDCRAAYIFTVLGEEEMKRIEKYLDAYDEVFEKVLIRPYDKYLWKPFKKLVDKLIGRFL